MDIDGGQIQEEQLAELETVVEVMREQYGHEVAMLDDEPWTAERHDREVAPRAEEEEGFYRHVINFDVAPEDIEEAYRTATEIAAELGLTENLNNSNGLTEYNKVYFGAGREEGRVFAMAGESSESFRATYTTRRSDHESLDEAFHRVAERNHEDRSPDNPRQLEDIEGEG